MSQKNKEVVKIEKRIRKDWANMIIEERRTFEEEYSNLYSALKERYDTEFEKLHDKSSKIDLLQEFMDEINEANHDMKFNHSISERAESKESALKSLHRTFESELNSLMSVHNKTRIPKKSVVKKKGKGGRPKAKVLNAIDYIHSSSLPENNQKFLNDLREVYNGCEKKTFVLLMWVLFKKGLLKSATKFEIQKAFEVAIQPFNVQSETNFNNYYNEESTKDPNYNGIFTKVSKIANDNFLF